MVNLKPIRLHWIKGAADDPMDLCAHGDVIFRIGDDVLLATNGESLTVSAAALYLLRTLSVSHTRRAPVGDHLFPCCGFAMWDVTGELDVSLCGCPNGYDFEVTHQSDGAGVVIRTVDNREWQIGWPEWRAAVFEFADEVFDFYVACSPKQPNADDTAGFAKFLAEWERRRGKMDGRSGWPA